MIAPVWHLAITVSIFVAVFALPLAFRSHQPNHPKPISPSAGLFAAALVLYGLFAGWVLWGLKLRGTPVLRIIGRTWKSFEDVTRDLLIGIGALAVTLLGDFLFMQFGHFYHGRMTVLAKTPTQLTFELAAFFAAGVVEELIFRGYLMRQFDNFIGTPWITNAMQASLFAMAHGADQTLIGFMSKFFGAILLGWIAKRTDSLLPGMATHVMLDVGVGLVIWLVRHGA